MNPIEINVNGNNGHDTRNLKESLRHIIQLRRSSWILKMTHILSVHDIAGIEDDLAFRLMSKDLIRGIGESLSRAE
jgi:hypothetical protein